MLYFICQIYRFLLNNPAFSDYYFALSGLIDFYCLYPDISPVSDFPTLEENPPTVREGKLFEQKIHLKWIVAPCPFIVIK